ncbi:hypothetical protein CC1G_03086 [Coprinopsis cinerea okayama7|uniref:Uncharacterized protein n=1 Tax=Coprinopsis cinerea (strain Okayama-7 / 130 / ATCC MYA-4618 / FGSC 9003) TaxID=240176 RepID=A8PEW1_COPC7|nr:hypothetical protein CC1G_03086 [Coprinopsis cinerea okayama7\|eukprot:XP_001840857.2 hypothetical protein CC1G_03086 [Coprinopsis cinerea okayama7\
MRLRQFCGVLRLAFSMLSGRDSCANAPIGQVNRKNNPRSSSRRCRYSRDSSATSSETHYQCLLYQPNPSCLRASPAPSLSLSLEASPLGVRNLALRTLRSQQDIPQFSEATILGRLVAWSSYLSVLRTLAYDFSGFPGLWDAASSPPSAPLLGENAGLRLGVSFSLPCRWPSRNSRQIQLHGLRLVVLFGGTSQASGTILPIYSNSGTNDGSGDWQLDLYRWGNWRSYKENFC